MARAPRAKVSLTSGQGVSRKAYQQARQIAGPALLKGEFSAGDSGGRERYAKKGAKADYPSGFNVSYGDTYEPTDLADIKEMAKRKPGKSSVTNKQNKTKRFK
jgi:hypothetical protein